MSYRPLFLLLLAGAVATASSCRDKEEPPAPAKPAPAAPAAAVATPVPATPTPAPPVELGEGLSYRTILPGTGAVVAEKQLALMEMTMTTASGTELWKGNFAFVVGSGQAMPGLDKGIRGMTVGETREVTIPNAQARTFSGQPPQGLPEGETLVVRTSLKKATDPPAKKGS